MSGVPGQLVSIVLLVSDYFVIAIAIACVRMCGD